MSQAVWDFPENVYIGDIQANPETAIADATYYPASGSFIDVSGYSRFGFLIHPGALDSALTFQVRQDTSATVTGAVKALTGALASVAATDDNKYFFVEVNTNQLDGAGGFRFVTLYATGAAAGDDFAALFFFAWASRLGPVTQPANLPAANIIRLLA